MNRIVVTTLGTLGDLYPMIGVVLKLPPSQIFPHACAIVHQGGIGTTAQALWAGRPTLVMPYSHNQPDNAARLQRLGTSRTISCDRYSASRVAKELRELLENPNYAANAKAIVQVVHDAIARAIAFAIEQPADVDVNEIIVRPIGQPS